MTVDALHLGISFVLMAMCNVHGDQRLKLGEANHLGRQFTTSASCFEGHLLVREFVLGMHVPTVFVAKTVFGLPHGNVRSLPSTVWMRTFGGLRHASMTPSTARI